MTSTELENLVKIGKLKREAPTDEEIKGLMHSAQKRLHDCEIQTLAFESRFDLAYNAAHALALAALRKASYRSDSRYLVFQSLQHTLDMPPAEWRVLAKAHERRNIAEYEGHLEQDEKLLAEVIAIAKRVQKKLQPPPPADAD
jgi:hypothetical protein